MSSRSGCRVRAIDHLVRPPSAAEQPVERAAVDGHDDHGGERADDRKPQGKGRFKDARPKEVHAEEASEDVEARRQAEQQRDGGLNEEKSREEGGKDALGRA